MKSIKCKFIGFAKSGQMRDRHTADAVASVTYATQNAMATARHIYINGHPAAGIVAGHPVTIVYPSGRTRECRG